MRQYINDQETFKELFEQLATTMGASTRIFKQLNSKAIKGLDNITDMLKLRSLSMSSLVVEFADW